MLDSKAVTTLRRASNLARPSCAHRPLRHVRSVTMRAPGSPSSGPSSSPSAAPQAEMSFSPTSGPSSSATSGVYSSPSGHPFAELGNLGNLGNMMMDDRDRGSSAAASEPLSSIPDSLTDFPPSLSSDTEPDASTMEVARVALRAPWNTSARRRRHPFDSHAFVSRLEKATLDANASKALMEGTRGLIVRRTEQSTGKMLSREEADNEAYVFRAALSKLRTEFNVRGRNTGLAARNALGAVRRELEHVDRKMAGDMQVLKHDVEMEMNSSKDENRTDWKKLDIQIEEIKSRATISIGDLRTEIESAKWDSTRRAITIIIVLVICGVGISTLTLGPDKHETHPPAPKTEDPTTRDIGIGPDEDPFDDDYEARIDKILKSVPPPEPREKRTRPRSRSSPDVFVDRI